MDVKQNARGLATAWLHWILAPLLILIAGCAPTVPDVQLIPAPGQYTDTVNIELIIRDAVEIYYTTDGTAPTADCLQYFLGAIGRKDLKAAESLCEQ